MSLRTQSPPYPLAFAAKTELLGAAHLTTRELSERSADPQQVSHYLQQLVERHPEFWLSLQAHPQQLLWFTTLFGLSRSLSEELLRHPAWIDDLGDLAAGFSKPVMMSRLNDFLENRTPRSTALDLALFRRREMIRIVLRDALGVATLAETTDQLSNLADTILSFALEDVLATLSARHGIPVDSNTAQGIPSRFTVIALGKLGGKELNYSSDIDLMFLYSDNGETSGPHVLTNKEFFKKVSNQLTSQLSTYTAAGICYRTDLRLRPEGKLGDICTALEAAKEYYRKRARDWELQMFIKARVTAGDAQLGQELLDFLEPSIYSTSLDFATIETMSATRERIGEKLSRKRLRKNEIDIKLATGGIRDIEFLVQCMQRLHGARESWVRHGGTLLALERLHDKDLLSDTEYGRLVDSYVFLRNLEHRLQIEDDRQTHTLATDPKSLNRIAGRMPGAPVGGDSQVNATQFLQVLNTHLEEVQGIYERIVHAQRPLYYTSPAIFMPLENVPSVRDGDEPLSLPADLDERVRVRLPLFLERLEAHHIQHSRTVIDFLRNVLERENYCLLLQEHPGVADSAAQVFKLSPYLSEQLAYHPDLLEEVRRVVDHPTRRWAFEGLAAPLNDVDGLRSLYSREMVRIQTASICLAEPVFQTLDRTSAMAEFLIARAYRIAREQALAHARTHSKPQEPFEEPQNDMMVVALGRLGMREFDLGSDADLLFILPDSEIVRHRFWTRVAEHLIEILTAYTGQGPVLSLDTRLRPDGREGMLVQTESKYVEYFSNKAEAWEGIAYMKARAVAGDTERATQFLIELQRVDWRRYGQSGRSKQDLRTMRMRLQREQGNSAPLKAGMGGFYDSDFILMYLRLKGAGMFFKSLNTPERIDIVEKMGHLERTDAEFLLQATTFNRAVDHAVRLVTGRAEERLPRTRGELEKVAELVSRWVSERPTADTLENELAALHAKTRRLFDSVFTH